MTKQAPSCPLCKSKNFWKDGIRKTKHGNIQRYYCGNCGYRFSENSFNRSNEPEHVQRIHREPLNTPPSLLSNRQICVTQPTETKNLVEVESRIRNQAAGATTTPNKSDTKSELFQFAWWMKKQGYAESTITTRVRLLRVLVKRGANLLDPESIKESIALQKWCNKRKVNAADAYTAYLRMQGKKWDPPKYRVAEKLPFISTEAELDALISGTGPKTSTFLQLLKETGMRAGEAHRTAWTDIDFMSGTVRVTPEKGSRARIFKLSHTLLSMLLAIKPQCKPNRIFTKHIRTQRPSSKNNEQT